MPMEWDPKLELQLEEMYLQYRLQWNAIDALLCKFTDDAVLIWLNGGSRPRNAVLLSPGSRPYFTHGASRNMGAGESSRARRELYLHPASSRAIDLDSYSDYEFL